MEITTSRGVPDAGEDAARRGRARLRLYVAAQLGGWGLFLLVQGAAMKAFPDAEEAYGNWDIAAFSVMVASSGLLLTHAFRAWMQRFGWKRLGWRGLVPRVLLAALLLSAIWAGFLDGYFHGVLGEPWHAKHHSRVLLFALSTINGTFLFSAWFCLYFFYHVFDRLNRSEIERFQLMTSVKEAELRALKSQVNPHFIFNALNSLRGLIAEDPVRARQAVTQLANLLRYSLQSGQLETVPFEDELRIVNDYLALEQVRLEERLRLRLDIAADTLRLPVPPLLLQTLVENAVKYGISPRPEGGEIVIVVRRDGERLRIEVSNPGEIDLMSTSPSASTGLGLRNAEERLRLIFGANATLRLLRTLPSRVVAEAIIPLPTGS
jgi:signal transduction histidine kinase